MTARLDPLEKQESLRGPFLGSLLMHLLVFSFSFLYSWYLAHNRIQFGEANAVPGGAVPVNIVKGLPMPPAQTEVENPVANDTHSSVPAPPAEKAGRQQERVEPEEKAIPLPGKAKKAAPRQTPLRKFRPYVPDRDNQLFASKGMGVNTQSYSGLQSESFGTGVGIGSGSPFGAYYGWYAEALQRRIGEQWQKELTQLDQRIRTPPRTVVFFEIQRDGSLHNIRLVQSSGNSAVDFAALRAVKNSDPVPPLPSGLAKSYVSTEVWFEIRR
jgi:TonB family protein